MIVMYCFAVVEMYAVVAPEAQRPAWQVQRLRHWCSMVELESDVRVEAQMLAPVD